MRGIVSILTSLALLGNSLFGWNNIEDKSEKVNEEMIVVNINTTKKPTKFIYSHTTKNLVKKDEEHAEKKEDKVEDVKPVNTEPEKSEKELKQEEFDSKLNEIINIEDNKEWFISYKDLTFKYAKWIDIPETVFDAFTEEEVNLICRMVETECYQQDFDSKVNVACVAFNRFNSGKFGDTMKDVITTKNQFAYGRKNLTEDTILAVQYAFEMVDTTQGALFFHSMKKTETFCKRKWKFTDKAGHHFY